MVKPLESADENTAKKQSDWLQELKATGILGRGGEKIQFSRVEVQEKHRALEEWVEAVNSLKDYGEWRSDISFNIADVDGIIDKYT